MKRIVSLMVCVFLMLSAVAFAENATTELQGMYAEAELLMAQGDYSGAASKFEALGAYSDASQMAMYCKAIAAAETLGLYDVAVMTFGNLGDFRDSKQMVTYYTARGNEAAADAVDIEDASDNELNKAIHNYEEAAKGYTELALFKDCLSRLSDCAEKEGNIKAEQEKRNAENIENQYQTAVSLQEKGEYQKAIDIFITIIEYKDSEERKSICEEAIKESQYQKAVSMQESGKYEEAISVFNEIKDYKDCAERIAACNIAIMESKYQKAVALQESGKYQEAIDKYTELGTYNDCIERIHQCYYQIAVSYQSENMYEVAADTYRLTDSYEDSEERYNYCMISLGLNISLNYTKQSLGTAIKVFDYYRESFEQLGGEDMSKALVGRWNLTSFRYQNNGSQYTPFHAIYDFKDESYTQVYAVHDDGEYYQSSLFSGNYSITDGVLLMQQFYRDNTYEVRRIADGYLVFYEVAENGRDRRVTNIAIEVKKTNDAIYPYNYNDEDYSENEVEERAIENEEELENEYNRAVELQDHHTYEDYDEARKIFENLGDYKDSQTRMKTCYFNHEFMNWLGTDNFYLHRSTVNDKGLLEEYQDEFRLLTNEEIRLSLEGNTWMVHKFNELSLPVFVCTYNDGVAKRIYKYDGGWKDYDFEQKYVIEDGLFIATSADPGIKEKGKKFPYQVKKVCDGHLVFFRPDEKGEYSIAAMYLMLLNDELTTTNVLAFDPELLKAEELEAKRLDEFTDKETVKLLQTALNDAGYSCGTPDGVAGKNTQNAISNYQRDKGLTITGTATYETLVSLGIME